MLFELNRYCIANPLMDYEKNGNIIIYKLLRYLTEHYREATLESTAMELGYNKRYLCSLIKKTTGVTFSKLLNSIKLNMAESLLRNTEMSIASIAIQTGFENPSYFYKMFKQKNSRTPSEIRETYQKKL